jgi:hydroxylamine reductase
MFCFQCQETAKNTGCTLRDVCGKLEELARMQDLLIFVLKGISIYGTKARELGIENKKADKFLFDGLFMTITNSNFDDEIFIEAIREGLKNPGGLSGEVDS